MWFTTNAGCAISISDISWLVTVAAESKAVAVELVLEKSPVVHG